MNLVKPTEITPEGFIQLVKIRIKEKYPDVTGTSTISRKMHVAPITLSKMLSGKHDFARESTDERKVRPVAEAVLRICVHLELDPLACLVACGIDTRYIHRLKTIHPGEVHITEMDAQRILDIAKALGKPIPLNLLMRLLTLPSV